MARQGERIPRVMARLPFAPPISTAGTSEGLAVGLSQQEDTGDDRAYIVVETDPETSRSALKRAVEAGGFTVRDWKYARTGGDPLYLVEVTGCVPPEDPRIARLPSDDAAIRAAWSVGGYARPLDAAQLA
jgi:hypothetical protein